MKTKSKYKIRNCQKEDLRKLEWDDELSQFRNLYNSTFTKAQNGEVTMLVAKIDDFPVGQIWIDLTKKKKELVGILYALRVMKKYQRRGIGTALIEKAEKILKDNNYQIAEISVDKTNPDAKRLYEKLEYNVVKEKIGKWSYKNPKGKITNIITPEWQLQKKLK